jgi:redox-sensing transcriptional repressor
MQNAKIPAPTLARLATYYGALGEAEKGNRAYINSAGLETLCGIAATQVRKDLSHFGELGKPGVGYEVTPLRKHIAAILRIDSPQRVAVIGAGRLGQALSAYPGLGEYGFKVVALFDNDASKIGTDVAGLTVQDARSISTCLPKTGARIAVLTVPGTAAQDAADAAVEGGARWLLNFTPAHVRVPANCMVRDVSVTQEFAVLAHYTED